MRAGTLDGEEEEIHNGYVYQSDKNGIQASWLAQDGESGIFAYWVTVITDLGKALFLFGYFCTHILLLRQESIDTLKFKSHFK